ncbi:MAG: MBOAT family protein [Lachnospiraceae bacterium]|nr:MBOAT family protein [Lachnospiraceae bacterium]
MLSTILWAGKGVSLTSFFSVMYFTMFLPACIVLFALTPKKAKKYFVIFVSYMFFWFISGLLLAYLILSTVSMYFFGLWLSKVKDKLKQESAGLEKEERKALKEKYNNKERGIVILSVVLHIGGLLVLKYAGFFSDNVNLLLNKFGIAGSIKAPQFMLPIGISFFSLQALSYILDVHYGKIKADRNIGRLALFICFFPQIVEGPICRYDQTANQLWEIKQITYENLTFGIQRLLYGMLKKIVVADRLNTFVDHIFSNYSSFHGGVIAFAAVAYTIQLYMDFSGSMDAVIGTAQIFGIQMPENFKHPFFSRTISEFWTRWHISLGTWFKDYIFYPITSAKKIKKLTSSARKKIGNHYGPLLAGSIALFAVWACNGLWHGAAWNFIFFGMYHFVLILIGSLINPLVRKTNSKLKINPDAKWYRAVQIFRTCVLVVIGELFFRAYGLKNGLHMFKRMVTNFSFLLIDETTMKTIGVDAKDFIIVGMVVIIVLCVSILSEKGVSVRRKLADTNIVVRWIVLYALILCIVVFGAYGYGYVVVDPLYAQY